MSKCLFCAFVAHKLPFHLIWEDDHHLAFLTIFPSTPGVTVVIPKKHHGSNVFDLPADVRAALIEAATTVNQLLVRAFGNVGRSALVFEGFGIDHVHAKLIPLHGTRLKTWRPIEATEHPFFEQYPGFITTHDGPRAEDSVLTELASRIRTARPRRAPCRKKRT